MPGWERALLITVAAATYGARAALVVLVWAGAVGLAWVILTAPRRSGRCPEIAGCRDDGPIARFAGSVVRGQLAPLPPAVAGLLATVLLAVLGLHGLAGPVLLTPVAAMLLAAPGSAHPHNGAADWLAPAVVQAGEYVYLVALGFAKGVPGPLTCALIALVALRQLDAAQAAGLPGASPQRYGGIGWEGRMLAAGAGAMIGLATFSYLALAAYLGLAAVLHRAVRVGGGPAAAQGHPPRPDVSQPGGRPGGEPALPEPSGPVAPAARRSRAARMPAVEGVTMLQLRQAPLRRCVPGAAGWQSPVNHPAALAGGVVRLLCAVRGRHGAVQQQWPAPAVGGIRGRCVPAGRRARWRPGSHPGARTWRCWPPWPGRCSCRSGCWPPRPGGSPRSGSSRGPPGCSSSMARRMRARRSWP